MAMAMGHGPHAPGAHDCHGLREVLAVALVGMILAAVLV